MALRQYKNKQAIISGGKVFSTIPIKLGISFLDVYFYYVRTRDCKACEAVHRSRIKRGGEEDEPR